MGNTLKSCLGQTFYCCNPEQKCFSCITRWFEKTEELRLVMFGLDCAGKTSTYLFITYYLLLYLTYFTA